MSVAEWPDTCGIHHRMILWIYLYICVYITCIYIKQKTVYVYVCIKNELLETHNLLTAIAFEPTTI